MGKGGETLLSGWRGRLLKEWTVTTQINAGSGLPETPVYLAVVPGTGVTDTIRPDLTGAPLYNASDGLPSECCCIFSAQLRASGERPARFDHRARYVQPGCGHWREPFDCAPLSISIFGLMRRTC